MPGNQNNFYYLYFLGYITAEYTSLLLPTSSKTIILQGVALDIISVALIIASSACLTFKL